MKKIILAAIFIFIGCSTPEERHESHKAFCDRFCGDDKVVWYTDSDGAYGGFVCVCQPKENENGSNNQQ